MLPGAQASGICAPERACDIRAPGSTHPRYLCPRQHLTQSGGGSAYVAQHDFNSAISCTSGLLLRVISNLTLDNMHARNCPYRYHRVLMTCSASVTLQSCSLRQTSKRITSRGGAPKALSAAANWAVQSSTITLSAIMILEPSSARERGCMRVCAPSFNCLKSITQWRQSGTWSHSWKPL